MVRQIHPEQLAEKLKSGKPICLLDVRQPWEHEYCALPNSVLIPLPELPARLDEVPSDQEEVVVYCHHGIRSLSGAAILEAAGIPAASLQGGIDLWTTLVDPKVPRY